MTASGHRASAHRIGRAAAEDDLFKRLHEVGARDAQRFAVGPQQPCVVSDQQPQRCDGRITGLKITYKGVQRISSA